MNIQRPAGELRKVTWCLVVCLVVSTALWEARSISSLDLDGETALSEGVTLYGLTQVREGRCPYGNFSVPPYAVSPYPPLMYYLPGWCARGLKTGPVGTLVIGRLFTWVAWGGIAVMIWLVVRQAGGGRLVAAFGMLLWLAGNLTPEYAIAFRPDAAALFLSLSGVWLYCRCDSGWGRAGAMGLLVLAFLCKQTATAALLVVLWEECRQKRWGEAVALAAGWAAVVGGTTVLTQWLSHGAFLPNVTGWLSLFTEWRWPVTMLLAVLALHPGSLLGGIVGLTCLTGDKTTTFLKRYFGVALVFAFVRTTNPGTAPSHYLEPAAVGCVLAALLLDRWAVVRGGQWLRFTWLGLTCGAVVLTLGQRVMRWPIYEREIVHHRAMRAAQVQAWEHLLAAMRAWSDPLLIEDPYLTLRCGRPVYLTDASALAVMQEHGRFDDAAVCRQITTGAFGAIVALRPLDQSDRWRFFPERWLTLMRARYRLAATYRLAHCDRTYYVYIPQAR